MEKLVTFLAGGVVAVVAVQLLMALVALLVAWPVMIAFGILHSYFAGVPAFGFFEVAALAWAVRCLMPSSSTATKEK